MTSMTRKCLCALGIVLSTWFAAAQKRWLASGETLATDGSITGRGRQRTNGPTGQTGWPSA